MRHQTLRRYLAYTLLVASLALATTASVKPQERKAQPVDAVPGVKGDCPRPIAMTLTASTPNANTSYADPLDFTPAMYAAPRALLNEQVPNKSFLYTFKWRKEGNCCEISRAVLTVKMKSLQPGTSKTSPDAGNDGISIMYNQSVVPPYSQAVYGSFTLPPVLGSPAVNYTFPVGQPAIKQWTLTGNALSYLNASNRLSIYVQDDTKVESATLQLWGCCLSGQGKDGAADSSTASQQE